jgi:hypothetical protein
MQICVALHYVDLNYDICVCLLNYVMNLTTLDYFADNSFEYLILLNAYKCVNVVCADATRCNLECPIEEHFFTRRSRCNLELLVKKNIQGLLESPAWAGPRTSSVSFCHLFLFPFSLSLFMLIFSLFFFVSTLNNCKNLNHF